MKRIFIVLLLIIFSSSFSLAKNDEKITMEVIKDILLYSEESRKIDWYMYDAGIIEKKYEKLKKSGTIEKRIKNRGLAKCMYKNLLEDDYLDGQFAMMNVNEKQCFSTLIRSTFSRTEKSQKRKPGTIFYAIEALERLVFEEKTINKFLGSRPASIGSDGKIKYYTLGDEVKPESNCIKYIPYTDGNYAQTERAFCIYYSKYTKKKLDKFRKDPSNEKVLGRPLIKYIKNVRMIRRIKKKIGNGNFALLGDMLNAVVVDVKKTNINPDLKIRKTLLNNYSLILRGIKKKLDESNYKSIESDVSKLSKTYNNLNALTTTTNEMIVNIDEAVNIIFDTNKLIQKSVLNSKDNKEEKLLALSSIYFIQISIDSILSIIPEKYYAETKELSRNLFNDEDLEELETIINTMVNKNKEIKSAELTESMNIINESFNSIKPSDVIEKLNSLGMKNILNRPLTQNTAAQIAKQNIKDNIDNEIFKDIRKIIQDMDRDQASDIAKEISDVAEEISEVSKEVSKTTTYNSVLDHKFGGQSLKRLIAISRR